mmetsp:Transcript_18312/g.26843  ORF Transcript_18312/g.26843 Transcript_18312/m.26843 type:complete len:91 (-) Transcript_18312:99-371(-)
MRPDIFVYEKMLIRAVGGALASSSSTATSYNTLQHTAAHCNTLLLPPSQRTGLGAAINMPQRTATHGNTMQHTATHGHSRQRTATHSKTL